VDLGPAGIALAAGLGATGHYRREVTVSFRRARGAACVVALAGVITACGSSQYTYVKNSDAQVYLKVPRSWTAINQEALDAEVFGDATSASGQFERMMSWNAAFDAHKKPSAEHIKATEVTDPLVWVMVRDLRPADANGMSLDRMRNLRLPITPAAREAAGIDESFGFELLADGRLNPRKGLYGVRSIFNYKFSELVQTFDQTVLTNDSHTKLYYLLARCSARCYSDRRSEIAAVVDSFTVRG
jgi:hypothetical protein